MLTCAGSSCFSTQLFDPQQLTEKWLFLQSMDSHPEQIALRPKEFFCTYDIEVLTEMQVRRVLCVPEGKCWYAEVVFREYGHCLCSWLTGCHCVNTGSPPAPLFLPQSAGCMCLFKTQLLCSKHNVPVAERHTGVTMVCLSLVTTMCYLPFLMWIWGARCHLIRIISSSNRAENDGLNISPRHFIYIGKPSRICEKATRNI